MLLLISSAQCLNIYSDVVCVCVCVWSNAIVIKSDGSIFSLRLSRCVKLCDRLRVPLLYFTSFPTNDLHYQMCHTHNGNTHQKFDASSERWNSPTEPPGWPRHEILLSFEFFECLYRSRTLVRIDVWWNKSNEILWNVLGLCWFVVENVAGDTVPTVKQGVWFGKQHCWLKWANPNEPAFAMIMGR